MNGGKAKVWEKDATKMGKLAFLKNNIDGK